MALKNVKLPSLLGDTRFQWVIISGAALFFSGLVATCFMGAFSWWSALLCIIGMSMASLLFLPKFSKNMRVYGDVTFYSLLVLLGLAMTFVVVMRHPVSIDATANKQYSLSPLTEDFLKRLDKNIRITAFMAGNERADAERLLGEYARHSSRISVRVLNPFQDFASTQEYGGTVTHGDIFIEAQTSATAEGKKRLVAVNKTSEEAVTNGIIQLLRGKDIKVYFITGHNELALMSAQHLAAITGARSNMNDASWLKKQLERNNITVEGLNLTQHGRVPGDADAVICIAPKSDFSGSECMNLKNYMDNGGRALFCIGPEIPTPTLDNLRRMLSDYGVDFPDAVAFSIEQDARGGVATGRVEVKAAGKHRVSQLDPNDPLLLTLTRVVKEAGNHSTDIMVEPLLQTSGKTIAVTAADLIRKSVPTPDPASIKPLDVAQAVTMYHDARSENENTKLVVVGCGDFLSSENITQSGYLLFMNAVNWLTSDADLVTVPTTEITNTPLIISDGAKRFLFILLVILIPTLVGLFGLGYSISRREWL